MTSSNEVNPDLLRERSRATFDVERVTNLLDGGKAGTERRRHLESVIANDPSGVFSNDDNAYLHRTDRHVRSLAKHVRLIEICRMLGIGNECGGQVIQSKDWFTILAALADDLPTALHWVMFVPNIVSLCDEEQKAEWLPLCRDWRMIGCYAQTELGHGSNVRALETTATFLHESRGGQPGGSFVINSPTPTSTKFWPGTLGRTANHAMVIARLIDGEGTDRGIHNFLVPLRSMKDHALLKGVTTGDIGPKIGYNVMDNGFARFDNVVIPRRNMAMKFAEVDENGKFRKKAVSDATSKVTYITMMQVRAYIINEAGKNLAIASTISIRYSAVRRQGFSQDGDEKLILDYKQQQHRLLPMLAASYCFYFAGKKELEILSGLEERLVAHKVVTKEEVTDSHASLSALKSWCTTVAADGIEDCRKACGGHGFLQCSGLAELYTSYLQNPTVEGDNQMLPQQVVRVLLKLVQAVESKSDLGSYANCDSRHLIPFLTSIVWSKNTEHCKASNAQEISELPALLSAFGHRAARLLVDVQRQIEAAVIGGKAMDDAWNDALIQMARFSRAYSVLLVLHHTVAALDAQAQDDTIGHNELSVLHDLARLFALYWMEKDLGDFLEDEYFHANQASWVRELVLEVLDAVRPNAVALVDARDLSDFRLKSALGRYDGDVYPAIMKSSIRDPLNQTEPGPGYAEHLKRLIVNGVGMYSGTAPRL